MSVLCAVLLAVSVGGEVGNEVDPTRTIVGIKEQWRSPGDVLVTFVGGGHKHADDGGAVGTWTFRFERSGAEPVVERIMGQMPEAELAVFGRLYLIGPTKVRDRLRVHEQKLTEPLTDAAALVIAAKHAANAGIAFDGSSTSARSGIYDIVLRRGQADVLRMRVGQYTRRMLSVDASK